MTATTIPLETLPREILQHNLGAFLSMKDITRLSWTCKAMKESLDSYLMQARLAQSLKNSDIYATISSLMDDDDASSIKRKMTKDLVKRLIPGTFWVLLNNDLALNWDLAHRPPFFSMTNHGDLQSGAVLRLPCINMPNSPPDAHAELWLTAFNAKDSPWYEVSIILPSPSLVLLENKNVQKDFQYQALQRIDQITQSAGLANNRGFGAPRLPLDQCQVLPNGSILLPFSHIGSTRIPPKMDHNIIHGLMEFVFTPNTIPAGWTPADTHSPYHDPFCFAVKELLTDFAIATRDFDMKTLGSEGNASQSWNVYSDDQVRMLQAFIKENMPLVHEIRKKMLDEFSNIDLKLKLFNKFWKDTAVPTFDAVLSS